MADENPPAAVPAVPTPTPPAATPAVNPAPSAAPPPAAAIVVSGELSESSARTAQELAATRERLLNTEKRTMELEDELKRLKSIPAPTPPKEKTAFIQGWMPVIR